MKTGTLTHVALAITFATLWLPVGQTEFLLAHWMKVGFFAAPLLLLGYAVGRAQDDVPALGDLRWSSLVLLLAYIAHQFEEHWVDVLGNEYAFHGYVNNLLQGLLGLGPEHEVLSRMGIFVINTSLVWLVGALAMVRAPQHAFPALAMTAIVVVNAVTHTLGSVVTMAYNPGVLTSVLVFLPLGVAVYRRFLQDHPDRKREVIASILWGVFAHVVMVAGTAAANGLGLFPEPAYFAVLVGLSILPSFLFSSKPPA